MASDLDIILLAFLHGAFIACVLLLLVFLIFIALLLSFSLTLFSIVALDLYTASSTFFSSRFEAAKANLQLGFVLILCNLLPHAIAVVSSCRPWLDRTISRVKEKARLAMNRFDALLLVKAGRFS